MQGSKDQGAQKLCFGRWVDGCRILAGSFLRLRWDSGDEVTCFQWLPDLFQDPKKGDVDDLMEHNLLDFEDGPSR